MGREVVFVVGYRRYGGGRTATCFGRGVGNGMARVRLYRSYTGRLKLVGSFDTRGFFTSAFLNGLLNTNVPTVGVLSNVSEYSDYNSAFGSVMDDNLINYTSYCSGFTSGLRPSVFGLRKGTGRINGGVACARIPSRPRDGRRTTTRRPGSRLRGLGSSVGLTVGRREFRSTTIVESGVGRLNRGRWIVGG